MDPIARRLASHPTNPALRIAARATLLREGLSPSLLRSYLRKDWHSVHPGVVAIGDAALEDLECRALAAALSAGSDAVVSHTTAAQLHSINGADGLAGVWSPDRTIHLTVPRCRHQRHDPAITLHRCGLQQNQVGTLGTIPMTDVVRTLADVALHLPDEVVVVLIESALHQRRLRRDELGAIARLLANRPGSNQARAAIARVRPGAESPLETLSRLRLAGQGLEPVALQHPVIDSRGRVIARTDFLFRRGGRLVAGEADGVESHNGRRLRHDDAVREEAIRRQGIEVVRWRWADMVAGMGDVAPRIEAFLAQ